MPINLKVSNEGWVKVQPPPRPAPRKRYVDPEEQKETLCAPLRYFACQAVDPGRERVRMLAGRAGLGGSQVDLLRPHSRLERSSTLDQWRNDVQPSRSSSRQSGLIFEDPPPRHNTSQSGSSDGSQRRCKDREAQYGSSPDNHPENGTTASRSSREKRRDRVASAPVVISVSPPPSIRSETPSKADNVVEVEEYPDNVSVAYSETPSERVCRHKHQHHKIQKPPCVIPEEDELKLTQVTLSAPAPTIVPSSAASEIFCLREVKEDLVAPIGVAVPAPPPSIAISDTQRSKKAQINIPTSIPEDIPVSPGPKSVISERSERSERSSRSSRSSKSSKSSTSSRSSATSRSHETESDISSSYASSVRSVSPVREQPSTVKKNRQESYKDTQAYKDYQEYKDYSDFKAGRYACDFDQESECSSRPPSPGPLARNPRAVSNPLLKDRNRVATAPLPSSKPVPSTSTWSSSSSKSGSSSSGSRSSAPSIDGYQFQAAIFQPKGHYRGYRAPSLSKGNRWETATSALSFD